MTAKLCEQCQRVRDELQPPMVGFVMCPACIGRFEAPPAANSRPPLPQEVIELLADGSPPVGHDIEEVIVSMAQELKALRQRAMTADTDPMTDLQRESAHVNELNGVVAFLVGAIDRIRQCETVEAARTCAEMALQAIAERHAGLWTPGPHDDPANWRTG